MEDEENKQEAVQESEESNDIEKSNDTGENLDEDNGLPFPRARVVNIIKNEIGRDKQIRSEVKEAINIWLGDLLKRIAREMGDTQYASIGIADFQRATKPYDMINDIVKDEERLILSTEKLKSDSDHISRELKRFFEVITGEKRE